MKISIIKYKSYAIWIAIGLYFLCYAMYEFYIPKSVGKNDFPLMLEWTTKLNNRVEEISITNDHILARLAYSLNSIDQANGSLLWKHIFNEKTSSVISRNGIVYLVAKENLYAFDEETGKIKWQKSIWQDKGYFVSQSGEIVEISDDYIVVNFISTEFRVYKTQSGDLMGIIPAGRGNQDACIYNNELFTFDDYPASYDLSTGELLSENKSIQRIWGHLCDNGILYFSQGGAYIAAYDLETKSILWKSLFPTVESVQLEDFNVQDDYLFVTDATALYVINKKSGVVIKQITEKEKPVYPQIIHNHLFVLFGFDRIVYAYTAGTWENSGILKITPPIFLYTDRKTIYHKNNLLILLKNKTIFAYK